MRDGAKPSRAVSPQKTTPLCYVSYYEPISRSDAVISFVEFVDEKWEKQIGGDIVHQIVFYVELR